jgi:hypothetical protein
MGQPARGNARAPLVEHIDQVEGTGELKHLSTRWKRYSLSRGDRKGSSLNRVRAKPAGVARAVSWDRLSCSAELERSYKTGG